MMQEHPGLLVVNREARKPVTWGLDPAMRHLNHGSFGAVPMDVM